MASEPAPPTVCNIGPPMSGALLALLTLSAAAVAVLWRQGLPGVLLFHAGTMLVAWGVCVPVGTLIARYFKITRRQDFPRELDNQFWWHWHRVLQGSGVGLASAGFFAIVVENGLDLSTGHAILGLAVLAVGWCQILSGLLRGTKGGPTCPCLRGDHFDMTLRRRIFEAVHKSLGWLTIPLSFAAMSTGLELAGMPEAMTIALGALAVLYIAAGLHFARQGRHVSTYMAIWGTAEPTSRQNPPRHTP